MAHKLKHIAGSLLLLNSVIVTAALTIFVFSSSLLLNSTAEAQLTCPERLIQQITDEPEDDSDQPRISGDGNLVTFRSEADFTGENPDNNSEIFVYNIEEDTYTQASNTTGGNCSSPTLSPDGQFVVFDCNADVNGMPGNGFDQIYMYELATGTITQITNANEDSEQAVLNGLNNQIVFQSEADFTGQNPINEDQMFLYDINSGTFKQITFSVFGITVFPSSNFEGNRIVFESSANLTGENPVPGGIREIFLYNRDNDSLTQITANTAGSSGVFRNGAITYAGDLVSIAASGNPNGGGTNFPTGRRKIYLSDFTFPIEEITTSPDAAAGVSAISGDGSCVVFTSEDDITGQNPQGIDQIFLYDVASEKTIQVTNFFGNTPRDPMVNEDCTRISFGRSIPKEFTNVQQIYTATCFAPGASPVPTLSEWGLIAMAGILGIIGFMVIRRKKAVA